MSGKATLILVIGFSLIFLVMGYLWESVATRSVDNHVSYYKNTVARNIAVSGANMGLNKALRDSNWVSDIIDKSYQNGYMTVEFDNSGATRILKSTGTFMGTEQKVRVKLVRSQKIFAKYAWFIPATSTGSVNRPWITGDSIWGGFHSNQFLVVDGDPVFFGKVTTLKGTKDQGKPPDSNPQFLGGYEDGINVAWNADMQFPDHAAKALEGSAIAGSACNFSGQDLWLEFHVDGTVTYRTGPKSSNGDTSKFSAPITKSLSQMAPTEVIYLTGGNVYMSGTISGKVYVVADGSSGVGTGNAYLTGDMMYKTDPMIPNGAGGYMINPASVDEEGNMLDMMGIMATNNILVATSKESGAYYKNVLNEDPIGEPVGINIDAAIFCVKGGFSVENLGSSKDGTDVPMGSIYLQGSMTAGKEEIVAQFSGNTITAGYNRHVIFDERFATGPPTWFYYVYYFRIVSWLE